MDIPVESKVGAFGDGASEPEGSLARTAGTIEIPSSFANVGDRELDSSLLDRQNTVAGGTLTRFDQQRSALFQGGQAELRVV